MATDYGNSEFEFIVNGVTFRMRRGTTEEWTREDPVLKRGEAGFDLVLRRIKKGDGMTPWRDLPWYAILV